MRVVRERIDYIAEEKLLIFIYLRIKTTFIGEVIARLDSQNLKRKSQLPKKKRRGKSSSFIDEPKHLLFNKRVALAQLHIMHMGENVTSHLVGPLGIYPIRNFLG